MSSISRGNGFDRVVAQQNASRQNAIDAFKSESWDEAKRQGVDAAASVMYPQAGKALKNYAKIFEYVDAPIATAMQDLLIYIGIPPNVFTAVKLLIESDSVGLDPHEKLGIPAWKYKITLEIHELLDELKLLEEKATFSAKLDRKNQIEQEVKKRLEMLRK